MSQELGSIIMATSFEGKVALVTGGNSGIGKASAIKFAQHGAKVVIAARRAAESEQALSEIRECGGEAIFIHTDVTICEQLRGLVTRVVASLGRLDYAVNSAAVRPIIALTHELADEDWELTININLKGVWLCMKYEIDQMLKQGGGAIVNISSMGGLVGFPNMSGYVASKFGVVGLTKTAALEYAQQGIRVNAVCPGYTLTPMTEPGYNNPEHRARLEAKQPIGRFARAEEIADAAWWLCSDSASFVTGHAMAVEGGYVAQ
jgi:NAD(P)-dependent dehydrogenase (short-subunit alcohol dehydrogenase family)